MSSIAAMVTRHYKMWRPFSSTISVEEETAEIHLSWEKRRLFSAKGKSLL